MPKRPSRRSLVAQDTQAEDTQQQQQQPASASNSGEGTSSSGSTLIQEKLELEPQQQQQQHQEPPSALEPATNAGPASSEIATSDGLRPSSVTDQLQAEGRESARVEAIAARQDLAEPLIHPAPAKLDLSTGDREHRSSASSSLGISPFGSGTTHHLLAPSTPYPGSTPSATPALVPQPFRRIASGFEAETAPGLGDRTRFVLPPSLDARVRSRASPVPPPTQQLQLHASAGASPYQPYTPGGGDYFAGSLIFGGADGGDALGPGSGDAQGASRGVLGAAAAVLNSAAERQAREQAAASARAVYLRSQQQQQQRRTEEASGSGGGVQTIRLCRNVLIYGHCRYEERGCPYLHYTPQVDPSAGNYYPRAEPDLPVERTPTYFDFSVPGELRRSRLAQQQDSRGQSVERSTHADFAPSTNGSHSEASTAATRLALKSQASSSVLAIDPNIWRTDDAVLPADPSFAAAAPSLPNPFLTSLPLTPSISSDKQHAQATQQGSLSSSSSTSSWSASNPPWISAVQQAKMASSTTSFKSAASGGPPSFTPFVPAAQQQQQQQQRATAADVAKRALPPVFTPRGGEPSTAGSTPTTTTFSTEHLAAPAFVPRSSQVPSFFEQTTSPEATFASSAADASSGAGPSTPRSTGLSSRALSQAPSMGSLVPDGDPHAQAYMTDGQGAGGAGREMDLYPIPETRRLDHHLYSAPLPHTANLPASHLPLHNFFLPQDLLQFVHQRAEAKHEVSAADASLPSELHVYHSLHALMAETTPQERSPRVFGFLSDVYRAKCRLDGRLYCLRRIEGFKLVKEAAFSVLEKWRRIRHPNIVSVREAFTTRLFGDSSVVFAYDYHPQSKTLFESHLSPSLLPVGAAPNALAIPERLFWSYVTQIANALKAIHTAGLACRTLEPTKVILTGRNRLRLNCCSIFDVITFDAPTNNLHYQQQDDLINFGKLLVSLCCGTTAAVHNLQTSLDAIQNAYSPDVKLVILYLLGKPGPGKCIDDILVMLGPRLLNEYDAMQNYADSLETGLEAEVENGRVARLLIKLGFINERPEFEQDTRWSETGDRYVLKLFRDYVFHSVDEVGHPVLDLSHVLTHLNKVDAASDEKLMLISRDDQSALIVSYRDLKHFVDLAYGELTGPAR